MANSTTGIAYDRAGPRGGTPVVLLHAGIADRRMWEPQWSTLTTTYDVVRLDLRGYGESASRPHGALSPVADVTDLLDELEISRAHLIAASFGAGVAVEVALTQPTRVESLLLSAPGGSLIPDMTPQLTEFVEAEDAALEAGDLDTAVQANLVTWVDGPHRDADQVDAGVRELVAAMQRRAFELTDDWDDVEEDELEPSALERLTEIVAPTRVLVGALDLDAIHNAADHVCAGVTRVERTSWADVAHLPSMERPDDFTALVDGWLGTNQVVVS